MVTSVLLGTALFFGLTFRFGLVTAIPLGTTLGLLAGLRRDSFRNQHYHPDRRPEFSLGHRQVRRVRIGWHRNRHHLRICCIQWRRSAPRTADRLYSGAHMRGSGWSTLGWRAGVATAVNTLTVLGFASGVAEKNSQPVVSGLIVGLVYVVSTWVFVGIFRPVLIWRSAPHSRSGEIATAPLWWASPQESAAASCTESPPVLSPLCSPS